MHTFKSLSVPYFFPLVLARRMGPVTRVVVCRSVVRVMAFPKVSCGWVYASEASMHVLS